MRQHAEAWIRYAWNVLILLCVSMPLGALLLALVQLVTIPTQRLDGVMQTALQALVHVYIWGGLTAMPMSLAHSMFLRAIFTPRLVPSLLLGIALGLVAGALTPTVFSGLFDVRSTLVGGFIGGLYGAMVHRSRNEIRD